MLYMSISLFKRDPGVCMSPDGTYQAAELAFKLWWLPGRPSGQIWPHDPNMTKYSTQIFFWFCPRTSKRKDRTDLMLYEPSKMSSNQQKKDISALRNFFFGSEKEHSNFNESTVWSASLNAILMFLSLPTPLSNILPPQILHSNPYLHFFSPTNSTTDVRIFPAMANKYFHSQHFPRPQPRRSPVIDSLRLPSARSPCVLTRLHARFISFLIDHIKLISQRFHFNRKNLTLISNHPKKLDNSVDF